MAYNILMLDAETPVRTAQIDGVTWFNAYDVFELLKLNPQKATDHCALLDPKDVSRFNTGTGGESRRAV